VLAICQDPCVWLVLKLEIHVYHCCQLRRITFISSFGAAPSVHGSHEFGAALHDMERCLALISVLPALHVQVPVRSSFGKRSTCVLCLSVLQVCVGFFYSFLVLHRMTCY
jgi:hypothetical protein